jgi:hypothetical protein
VGIGLLAGAYPALHLSGFQPIKVLKGNDLPRRGRLGLRKVLGVTQLVICAFFITTSILLYNQFRHYLSFEYGFPRGQHRQRRIGKARLRPGEKPSWRPVPGVARRIPC